MLISVVSPVYRAEKIVDELVRRNVLALSAITDDFEIILVEDCGPDNSWDKIVENCRKDSRVKGIKLSKNFGQHHAITAGLDHASGDWVVVMDCDLQDQPEEIIKLYEKTKEGYDIVYARRANRQDGFVKKLASQAFRWVFEWLSGIAIDKTIANFGIYNQKVIEATAQLREPMRDFNPMIRWVGFRSTSIDVVHASRYEGKSSYNFKKMANLALSTILAYSDKPLRMTVKLGLLISVLSFLFAIFNLFEYMTGRITQPGFTTLILSLWIIGGLIIFVLGIVGLYIGKIFEAVKHRPLYVISNIVNE
jgi:dolichol-phosphate mannosyltransferase